MENVSKEKDEVIENKKLEEVSENLVNQNVSGETKLSFWDKIKEFEKSHKRLCEIFRFVIVGGLATLIDMLVMGVILYLFNPSLYPRFYNVWVGKVGNPSTIATVVGTGTGFVVSLVFNYLLSVVFVIGLLINMGGMWLGYDVCHINEWITKIIMTLVVLVYNYVSRKLFIFKKDNKKQD